MNVLVQNRRDFMEHKSGKFLLNQVFEPAYRERICTRIF